MGLFGRGVRHPFYPALKVHSAARAGGRCVALWGTFHELAAAAEAGVEVARAVFPVHRAANPFLSDEQRDALWSMFRVPVMTILVDGRGAVIGYECELQDGFHLAEDYYGGLLFGTVESSTCDCGRPGPRLVREKPKVREPRL
jgi:hypothetical protein